MLTEAMIAKGLRQGWVHGSWEPFFAFIDFAGNQRRTPRSSRIDRLQKRLRLSTFDMKALVKSLESNGLITRPIGPRGGKAHIIWNFILSSIADVAKGSTLKRVAKRGRSLRKSSQYH